MQQKIKNIALITGAVLVIVIAGIIVVGVTTGHMIDVVYVSLIIVALLTLAVTVLQIIAIVRLIGTISMVRDEMKPLLVSVQETVGVVQETAKNANQTVATIGTAARFTNDFAVQPSVRVVALLMATQQVIRVFMGKGHVRSRADRRRKQQMEAEAAVGGE
jgi:hypothetical protein